MSQDSDQTNIFNPDGSLTREYLLSRGYCCENGCRHCPYGFNTPKSTAEQPTAAVVQSDPETR